MNTINYRQPSFHLNVDNFGGSKPQNKAKTAEELQTGISDSFTASDGLSSVKRTETRGLSPHKQSRAAAGTMSLTDSSHSGTDSLKTLTEEHLRYIDSVEASELDYSATSGYLISEPGKRETPERDTAGSSTKGTGLLKEILNNIPEKKFIKMHWTKSGEHATKKVPFDANFIMNNFTMSGSKDAQMEGSPGILKKDIHMVEVEQPGTLREIVGTMGTVNQMDVQNLGHEFGLMMYGDEEGNTRIMVQQGGFFVTKVQPYPLMIDPDGKRMLLLGILAHTHPFGAAVPSGGDFEAFIPYRKFGQEYSMLVLPNGAWCLFNETGYIDPYTLSFDQRNALLNMSVDSGLFRASGTEKK